MKTKKHLIYPIALLFIIAALIPWAIIQFTNAINTDIAFLTLSAQRMLSGLSMSEGYFDTNPPLSVIVQIPAILISKLGIPIYHAPNIYFLILLSLSIAASAALLNKIPNLTDSNKYIILACFLTISTIKTGYDFGQKDHILGLALFPLVLLQILITQKININNILYWSVLTAGSILILLKPHFGIIPAAIFLHRAVIQKRISVIFDQDFLTLAIAASVYIAIIFVFFADFINVILPDILKYYASDISPAVIETVIILLIIAIMPYITQLLFLKEEHPLIPIFSLIAALCLIPVLLQGKGWAYHAIPANMFMACAYGMLINASIAKLSGSKNISFLFTATLLLVVILQSTIQPNTIKKHDDIQNSELASIIQSCNDPCSFLILHDMINMPHELSIYTNKQHASRFPVMWFIPHFINPENKASIEEQRKYTKMITEDFLRWQPELLFITQFPHPSKEGEIFSYPKYLSETDPQFSDVWKNYTLEQTVNIDRLNYMERKKPNEDLIRYDIYRKKKAIKEPKP